MTVIWTHRGDGVENTIPAFESAWQKGITHFETDLQLTRDKVLVLSHDASIQRLTGMKLNISNLTYHELQNHTINGKVNWAKLSDLITSFPKAHISIDLKSDPTTPALIDLLNQNRNWINRLTIGSFSSKRVKTIRSVFPNAITSLTPNELLALKTFSRAIPSQDSSVYAMIPLRYNGLPFLTPRLREQLLFRNIPVHVWTINTDSDLELCQDLAVDGIVTDDIDRAKLILTKKSDS